MKLISMLGAVMMAALMMTTSADARGISGRVYYGGGHHTSSHGGSYTGGHGSSHRGGHYTNSRTGNHYGRHK